MEYNFYNFNSTDFEHLVQSLTQNLLGKNSITYGLGPDGGRELTYQGKAPFPNDIEMWDGYWVIQAKFKARDFIKQENYAWVEKNFCEELHQFVNGKRRLPDNYIFLTNAILTPGLDKGGRDKIEKVKKQYQQYIPNISIISYDELCRIIDNNHSVRTAYFHLLTPGDIFTHHLNTVNLKKEDINLAGNEIREKQMLPNFNLINSSSPIIGIDFGTSYSAAAICTRNLDIVFIPSDKGKLLIPSAVTFFENGNYIVGKTEYLKLQTNQIKTITNIKRHLGTNKVFEIFGKQYSTEEISSYIVKSIKTNAEEFLGYELKDVVISKPANFTLKQTNALIKVFQLAGLNILRILEEPSSASLVLNKKGNERFHYFVLDLGGGTLDISIIDASYGVYEIITVIGDNNLGGVDYDEALFVYAKEQFLIKFHSITSYDSAQLLIECEKVKKELGHSDNSIIFLGNIQLSDGNLGEFCLTISREQFITLTSELNTRIAKLIDLALTKVQNINLEGILLAGQGGKIFTVKEIIKNKFGELPLVDEFAENAVTKGVASFSGALSCMTKSNLILMNVFNYKLSIKCFGNVKSQNGYTYEHKLSADISTDSNFNTKFLTILKENTRLPKTEVFTLNIVDQKENFWLEIYLTDNSSEEKKYVGKCEVPLFGHRKIYLKISITEEATVLLIISYNKKGSDYYIQLNNLHKEERHYDNQRVFQRHLRKLNFEFEEGFLY